MEITAALIKELREATGAGVLDCRKALTDTSGDIAKATLILREKGLAAAAKRADRVTSDGVVELYSHGNGRVGVMVEVNCETDFVARTSEFRTFAHEMALQIAASAPKYIDIAHVPADVVAEEKSKALQVAQTEGKPAAVAEKIVEGRLAKFYQEVCLLQQVYIRDDKQSVGELLKSAIAATKENVTIRRFSRWELGEE
jgi:elongation factor Ts